MRVRRPTPTKLVITGAARSGTHYLAQLLRNAGIDATHEKARVSDTEWRDFGAGTVEVNSELGFRHVPVSVVGHVVRHPQRVVASIMGRGMWDEPWGALRLQECPALAQWPELDRSLAYWIEINRAVEQYANIRINVDVPLVSLIRLLDMAEIEFSDARLVKALFMTSEDIGHRSDTPPIEYDWEEHDPVLRATAELMMHRYGL